MDRGRETTEIRYLRGKGEVQYINGTGEKMEGRSEYGRIVVMGWKGRRRKEGRKKEVKELDRERC